MARDKGGAYVLEANAALARAAAFRHQPSSTRGWRVGPDQAWTPPVQADLPTLRKSQRERRPSYKARMAELYAEADEPSPKGTSTKRRKVERTGPHLGAPPGAAERLQPRPPIAKVPGSRVKARQPTADPGDRPINSVVQPIHVPVIRFPGEAPLHVETLLGEQDAHHSDAVPCATPETAYRRAVDAARARMVARAKRIGVERGMPELPGRSLAACETFERLCLEGGSSTASAIEREAACTEYDAVLREVYGGLMLDPHVLSVEALEAEEDTEDLQLMRCMERRFIIWRQELNSSGQDSQEEPRERPRSGLLERAGSWILDTFRGVPGPQQQDEQPSQPTLPWSVGLQRMWDEFQARLGDKEYGSVNLGTTEHAVSCALNDTVWCNGCLVRHPAPPTAAVLPSVQECIGGTRAGRLYLTDCSMPDYEARGYPRSAPGMPCAVDASANAMLPHAVRSNRATNLFHFIKCESTGSGTFSLFLPVGGGANLTAFHYETKRRRSYNCGLGDYIIQPLATADNELGLMPEEGLALDGADTWIQSAYLLSSPNTVAALRNDNTALFPPWRCEVAAAKWGTGSSRHQAIAQGDFSQLEQQEEVLDSEIHWGMDVVVVRTAEKLLDVLNGVLTPAKAAPWVGEVPSQGQAAAALTRLIPVLYHMLGRAVPEAACHQLGNGLEEPLAACHFSWEYLHLLLNKVEQAMGLPPSSRFAVDQRVEAARKGIAIDSRATWASAAEVEAALEDLKGCAALPPAHLRRLWMACLHREWAAAVARPVDVMALAARRRERAEMEKAWDAACCALIEKHRDGWGCGSFSEDQRSNGGHACMSD